MFETETAVAFGIAPAGNGKDLLIQLKDYRKNARHRADTSFDQWLTKSWETVALLIEHLASANPVENIPRDSG